MEYDILLNKIIEITEKNLQAQGEFVKAIYELKSRLDKDSYSKEDLKKDITELFRMINSMSSLMNQTSNKEIMALLQTVKDDRAILQNFLIEISNNTTHLKECTHDFVDHIKEHKTVTADIFDKVKSSNNLYKAVVAILTILTLSVGGIQLINKLRDDTRNDKIDKLIDKIDK